MFMCLYVYLRGTCSSGMARRSNYLRTVVVCSLVVSFSKVSSERSIENDYLAKQCLTTKYTVNI